MVGAYPAPEEIVPPFSRRRANRIRTLWFALGVCFGVMLSLFIYWSVTEPLPEEVIAEQQVKAVNPSEVEEVTVDEGPVWPKEISVTVASGDRMVDLLTEQGISNQEAFTIIESMKKTFDPRTLRPGKKLEMVLEKDPAREGDEATTLKALHIILSRIEQISVSTTDDGTFQVERVKKPLTATTDRGGGIITSSLYVTLQQEGVPVSTITELIRAYSYDVDFQRDIRNNDAVEILYEKLATAEGDYSEGGNVLYAELKTRGKSLRIFRYTMKNGTTLFFNEKGESVKKALLKTPVDGARISSRFGMRKHPILGYSKMHTGVDFAAPRGTPIYAAGDGVVSYAGRKGGYGNYISVRHNSRYTTAYAHCKRFARGMRKGRKVRQGQVIAYVGSTGRSTGPHLHYEIIKNGKKVNPGKVKFAGGEILKGKELANFKATKQRYLTKLAELRNPPVRKPVATETTDDKMAAVAE